MNVLVDTSVWSLAVRRSASPPAPAALELAELIRAGRVVLVGPVRQELLSGIRRPAHFELVKERLRPFRDIELDTRDFELAAEYFNTCRSKGIQGSNTDFLLCAVAARRRAAIFTTDGDFSHFAKLLPIQLHTAGS